MGFGNWFKQAAQAINAGVGIASVLVPTLGPLLSKLVPATAPAIQNMSDELPGIAAVILQLQAAGELTGASGDQKIKMAAVFVSQIVLRSPLAMGKKVSDKAKFDAGIINLTEGVLDIMKSFESVPELPAVPTPAPAKTALKA